MDNNFVKYPLIVICFFIYVKLFQFIWTYLPIGSSMGVLVGSLLVLITSLGLAIITGNKLMDAVRNLLSY